MKFWALLALAASVAVQAFPLEDQKAQLHTRDGGVKKHIGYRMTSKAEAENIYKNGGKAVQSLGTGGCQIGQGLYILPAFQSWPSPNDGKGEIQWDCIVTIDADEWDKWKKAYLPELFTFPKDAEKNKDTCKPLELWGMFPASKRNRQRFVGYVSLGATVENTVLFSKAKGKDYEHLTQGLLPLALIDTDKVYLSQCAERGTEGNKNIGKMGTADWGFVGSLPGYGMGKYK